MADDITALSDNLGFGGSINHQVVRAVFSDNRFTDQHRQITAWLFNQTGACFLQDADNLIMKTDNLVAVPDSSG